MIASKKIASDILLFGLFWICIFGEWHTVKALGDDSYIYLVDFDETAYDMYIQGYYPTDYTYADFRRDSIEGMVSHYVATDNNNFGAVVDTVENAIINDGWPAIKDFFENAWIDLKSGVVAVEEGFTDDFKHTLDGRFKNSGSIDGGAVTIGSGVWIGQTYLCKLSGWKCDALDIGGSNVAYTVYVSKLSNGTYIAASWCPYNSSAQVWGRPVQYDSGHGQLFFGLNDSYTFQGVRYSVRSNLSGFDNYMPSDTYGLTNQSYASSDIAFADFFGHQPIVEPTWNGDGYYSNTPTNYSINLPALPAIDWQSISNNNKTKYGVDFPDVNVSVEFQLPDMYYPKTVTYDVPYWLQNGDETVVDWQNISFDDVTLPSIEMEDGNGGFIQHLFTALPVGFSVFLLGVLLCYLIFIML